MEKALIVDWKKCAGCRTCEIICSLSHDNVCNPALSRIRIIRDEKNLFYYPGACAGCSEPVCKAVCPVKAISRSPESGAWVVNEEKCIGCRECVNHCPFGAANLHLVRKKSFKCDLCGGDPMCVKFCRPHALRYDYVDVSSRFRRRSRAEEVHRIAAETEDGKSEADHRTPAGACKGAPIERA